MTGSRRQERGRRRAGAAGRGRRLLARYVAPAAFLLAATAAALLVRESLRTDAPAPRTVPAAVSTAPATTAARTRPPARPKRYYVIRPGDTLELIAIRFDTSVDELLRLNPGIRPTALMPGGRVRVR